MKKIKIYLVIILQIAFAGCVTNKNMLKLHTVKSVDIETFTPIAVKCELFEEYFESSLQNHQIDKKKWSEFMKHFEDFTQRAEKYNNGYPDVRVIVKNVTDNTENDNICIGYNLVHYKGKVYINDDTFRSYLEEFLKYKH